MKEITNRFQENVPLQEFWLDFKLKHRGKAVKIIHFLVLPFLTSALFSILNFIPLSTHFSNPVFDLGLSHVILLLCFYQYQKLAIIPAFITLVWCYVLYLHGRLLYVMMMDHDETHHLVYMIVFQLLLSIGGVYLSHFLDGR